MLFNDSSHVRNSEFPKRKLTVSKLETDSFWLRNYDQLPLGKRAYSKLNEDYKAIHE